MRKYFFRAWIIIIVGILLSCNKDNLPPVAVFSVSPHLGDSLTVFYFDARGTYDPESPDFGIQIRWDWNGDGEWDTEYSHDKEHAKRFDTSGKRVIIMEAVDTKGVVSSYSDTIILSQQNPFVDSLTDPRDGNIYSIARINGYWIMTENLRFGQAISETGSQENNNITEFYHFQADKEKEHYGGLYTWEEALSYDLNPGVQGICPPGWHIPEISEWTEAFKIFPETGIDLIYYLGPDSPSGFNLEFFGMMNFVNPGDSTTGYYYENNAVAYWVSDKPITILQDPDKYIQRYLFRRHYRTAINHLYRRADFTNQDPVYTYAGYVRCFKDDVGESVSR